MANIENIKIGDVEVYVDDVHIGHTKGGVTFSFEREFTDLTVDKYGTSAIDMALTGNNLMVTVPLAEPTKENLSRAIPEGRYDEGVVDDKVGLGRTSGYLLRQNAVELRLHPRKNAASNTDDDIFIWKAVSSEAVELNFAIDEQQILEITYRALVDESQPDGYHLGRVGNALIS